MSGQSQRLALGTAQLGQRYGVANRTGQPDLEEAGRILSAARAAEMDTVDTAMTYGNSESVLGALGVAGFRVITKLAPLPEVTDGDTSRTIRRHVEESLRRLNCASLHGLLLHRPRDAIGPRGRDLVSTLRALQREGLVDKIGVSIYDPSELDPLTAVLDVGIVQAPYNVFDRRLESSGWLERLHNGGIEVHTRSAFLQGALLLEPGDRPAQFAAWDALWRQWHTWLSERRITPLSAALGFVLRNASIARVVVGAETAAQLRGIVAAAQALPFDPPAALACGDLDLIDPSRWKRA